MYAQVHSAVLTTVAVAGVGAVVAGPVAPPPESPRLPVVSAQVRLTAAPPLGAIPLAFLRNQSQYCSVICPHIVSGAVTVPLAAVQTPVTFLNALATTDSPARAIGATAASVTGPANTAAEGIILNDVDRVVPKAFNNLEISVVQLIRVGSAVLTPADLPDTVNIARKTILAALNQPLPPPVPTETGAETLPEVVAVEAIKVSAAVAFQAGELVLLGVVQTADAGAQELARSGDPQAAITAAVRQAGDVVDVASRIVTDSVDTAATNIRAALDDPFPSAANPKAAAKTAKAASENRRPVKVVRADKAVTTDKRANPQTRPVRKVVDDVRRTVKAVTDSLSATPRKSVQHNNSTSSEKRKHASKRHAAKQHAD